MGRVYTGLTDELARWLGAQPVFFVATAAPDPDTRVYDLSAGTIRSSARWSPDDRSA